MNYEIIVNRKIKCHDVDSKFLVKTDSIYKHDVTEIEYDIYLECETFNQWKKLKEEGLKFGYHYEIIGGFRTHDYQEEILKYYIEKIGKEDALKRVALPYHSEHETGLAIDFTYLRIGDDNKLHPKTIEENDKEYLWILKNMHKYGFILRYPKGKEEITGYIYEPWHIRYVGTNLAQKLYENNLTMEEYKIKHYVNS